MYELQRIEDDNAVTYQQFNELCHLHNSNRINFLINIRQIEFWLHQSLVEILRIFLLY